MHKIDKFFLRLSKEERESVNEALVKIFAEKLETLDVKKLKGNKSIFRVRVGKIRIVYKFDGINEPELLDMFRRGDNSYKEY